MAAFTTIAAGALIIGGATMSAVAADKKAKAGREMRKQGQEGIDNFEWQDIESAVPIRTEGIEMMREDNARFSADMMETLKQSGSRGLAHVGDLIRNQERMNQQARVAMEEQYMRRDYTKLGMIEQRQANELAGYGQLMNVGMNHEMQAQADMANAVSSAGYGMMAVGSIDANGDGVTGFGAGKGNKGNKGGKLTGKNYGWASMNEIPGASVQMLGAYTGNGWDYHDNWNNYYGGRKPRDF